MLSPSRSLRKAAASGQPLPRVEALADLYGRGLELRRSQLSMLTGRPKAGKTFVAQWLWSEVSKAGDDVHGLYFFLDGSPFTAGVRQAAWATGHRTQDVTAALEGAGAGYYEEALEGVTGVDFVFDRKPELPDIQQEIDAYVELWDRFPDWIVIDNLRNVAGCDEGHEAKKFALSEFQKLAFDTGAHVMVLAHATESGVKDYATPPKVSETEDKVNQYPEIILSLAKDPNAPLIRIAIAAMRDGGDSDPAALRPVTLDADLSRVQFKKPEPKTHINTFWQEIDDDD